MAVTGAVKREEFFAPTEVFAVLLRQLGGDMLVVDIRRLDAIHQMLSELAMENPVYMSRFVFTENHGVAHSPTLVDILKQFEDEGVLTGKTMTSYRIDWEKLNGFLPDDIRIYSEFKNSDALRQLMRRK
jgi:hypothetical protein